MDADVNSALDLYVTKYTTRFNFVDPLDLEGTEKVISFETPEESLPLEMASNIAENPQTISEVLDEKLSEESQIPNGEVSERILAQGYSAIPGSDNDSSDKGLNFNEALVLNSYEMLKQVKPHKDPLVYIRN